MSKNIKIFDIKNVMLMSHNNSRNYKAIVAYKNETFEVRGIKFDTDSEDGFTHCDVCNTSATIYMNLYAEYHGYLAIMVCIFGTVANIFNVMILTKKEMASAPINKMLTGLAATDIALMIEYILFAYYYHMKVMKEFRFPYWGAVFMLIHIHFTQIVHTVSICLTLALAVSRYLAIGNNFQYVSLKKLASSGAVINWVNIVNLSSILMMLSWYPERSSIPFSEKRYTVAISLSCILPVILCIPTYFTFSIQTIRIHENGTWNNLYRASLSTNENFIIFNLWMYAVVMKLVPCLILTIISAMLIKTLCNTKKRKRILKTYNHIPKDILKSEIVNKKKSKAERRTDRTTKMLVAVLVLFLITEFPQGILGLLSGLKGKCFFLTCYQVFGDIMDMLALINGSVSFILYCSMNRMFRIMFGQMMKKQVIMKWNGSSANLEIHTTALAATNIAEI